MSLSESLIIGGHWANEFGPWGDLSFSTVIDGGVDEISWRMSLPRGFAHRALRRGRLVEVMLGSGRVAIGILSEPTQDDAGWEFHASGLSVVGEHFAALNSGGGTSSVPDVAVDEAIGRGLLWNRPASVGSTSLTKSAETDSINSVTDLMNAYCSSVGRHWRITETRAVELYDESATPDWHMSPGSARLGLADDEYFSDLYVRFRDSTTKKLDSVLVSDTVARARYGRREARIDATPRGRISAATATAIGNSYRTRSRARLGWTTPLTPGLWQLLTPGGVPACFPLVKSGQVVRLHGVQDEQGQVVPYVDFVIGATHYNAAEKSLTLDPVGLPARSLSAVMQLQAKAVKKARRRKHKHHK